EGTFRRWRTYQRGRRTNEGNNAGSDRAFQELAARPHQHRVMIRSFCIVFTISVLGCGGENGRAPAVENRPPTQEEMIEENRNAIKLENHDIELYVRRSGHEMLSTGTGIRYRFVNDVEGEKAAPGQWAMVNYAALLIGGDTAYASDPGR